MSYGRRLLSLFLSIVTFETFSESIYHSKYDSNLLSRAVLALLLFLYHDCNQKVHEFNYFNFSG